MGQHETPLLVDPHARLPRRETSQRLLRIGMLNDSTALLHLAQGNLGESC